MEDLRRAFSLLIFLTCVATNTTLANEHWSAGQWVDPLYPSGNSADYNQFLRLPVRASDLPIPTSQWVQEETKHYKMIVGESSGDTLVFTPQIEGLGVSESLRALLGMLLSERVSASGLTPISNQFLIQKAFNGARSVPIADIKKIADKTSAHRIITPFVGYAHRKKGDIELLVTIEDHVKTGSDWQTRRSKTVVTAFAPNASPFDAFNSAMEELTPWLKLKDAPLVRKKKESNVLPSVLPSFNLSSTKLENAKPLQQIMYLQALGSITPWSTSHQRHEFFARSLHLLMGLPNVKGELDGLIARAYRELGLIALAKNTIKNSATKHCYQEVLRVNLSRLTDCAKLNKTADSALLMLDAFRTAESNGIKSNDYQDLVFKSLSASNDWLPFFHAFIQTYDHWTNPDSRWIKQDMDRLFPVDGYRYENLLQTLQTYPDNVRRTTNISPIRHYKLFKQRQSADFWPLETSLFHVTDKLNLLHSHALEALYREGVKIAKRQALPDAALRYASLLDIQLLDHPMVDHIKALAHFSAAKTANNDTVDYHYKQAYEHATRAYQWEQNESTTASAASSTLSYIRHPGLSMTTGFWAQDFPFVSWKLNRNFQNPGLDYFVLNFDIFKKNLESRIKQNLPLDELEEYFLDHPERNRIFLTQKMENAEWDEAAQLAERQLKNLPDRFESYNDLATIKLRQGLPEQAAKIWSQYPAFQESQPEKKLTHTYNLVDVSIKLGAAGRTDLAINFLEVAERYKTGSATSLMGLSDLYRLRGDFESWFRVMEYKASRYGDADSFADYLIALATLGQIEQVSNLFDGYVSKHENMIAWLPAHVSQRIENWDNQEILDWLKRDHIEAVKKPGWAQIKHYVRHITTDRGPANIDLDFIRKYTPLTVISEQHGFFASIDSVRELNPKIQNVEPWDTIKFPQPGTGKTIPGLVIPDEIETYVQLDQLTKQREFRKAYLRLPKLRRNYGYRPHSIMMYAWIYAEVEDYQTLKDMLKNIRPSNWSMPQELASAILQGYLGNHKAAVQHLEQAKGFALGTGNRWAISPYLIAKAMDILWEKTGIETYRSQAISWAQNAQLSHYYYAWPYALEAKLSTDSKARVAATTKAMYLDERSMWLQSVPENIRQSAQKNLDTTNPFLPEFPSDNSGAVNKS